MGLVGATWHKLGVHALGRMEHLHFMVAITVIARGVFAGLVVGGALINHYHILTAAHGVNKEPTMQQAVGSVAGTVFHCSSTNEHVFNFIRLAWE